MTLDLDKAFCERLENIKRMTYLGSNAAALRHALVLYETALILALQGAKITIEEPNGDKRVWDHLTLAAAG